MSEQSEETTPTYTIHLKVDGDLRIEGHDGTTVRMRHDDETEEKTLDQDLYIESRGDAYLSVPVNTPINIDRVGGDATIIGVGEVTAGKIGGDLRISDISLGCHVRKVGGDLKASNIVNLQVHSVAGDLRGENITGEFAVEAVGGDATIRGEVDSLPPMMVGGDLRLNTTWLPDRDYRATVGGDASIVIEEDTNIVLSATVGGDVRGISSSHGPGTFSATWGGEEGAARIELTVGGDLNVSGSGAQTGHSHSDHERSGWQSDEWSDMFHDFAEEMTTMGRELAAQFRSFGKEWGLNNTEQAADRARRAAERATERAAAAAERMRLHINDREIRISPERLERIKEQAQRAAEEGIARAQEAIDRALSGMDFGSGPRPPRPPREPRAPRPPRAPRVPFAASRPHAPQRINIDIEHDEDGDEHHAGPPPPPSFDHAGPPPPPATGQTIPFRRAESASTSQSEAAPEKTPADLTQERLAILRMVESGKISSEEAALLLEALG